MVQHEVDDDLDTPLMGLPDEQVKLIKRPEIFMDRVEIRDIIAEVEVRGTKDRGEPNGIHPKGFHVP